MIPSPYYADLRPVLGIEEEKKEEEENIQRNPQLDPETLQGKIRSPFNQMRFTRTT